jgi:hypothetical protein
MLAFALPGRGATRDHESEEAIMRRLFPALLAVLILTAVSASLAEAQKLPPARSYWTPPQSYVPESERHPGWYTVRGERDGPSMFRRHRHPEVEYEAGDAVTFDRYHTADVMYTWMHRWAERYPEIMDLYEVGRSFEGRPILQVTLTNKATGAHTDKPAAMFDGGHHSGEVTPSESVFYLMKHLLENYGSDPEVTHLLDTRTIYLRPQTNPDGSNLYLHTAQRNRSSVRPFDQDGDGLLDANPPVDLTGDGVIRQMRWHVGPGEGSYVVDERDPERRVMRRVLQGDGDWRVASEGVDHVGDGRFGSDGVGGLDLHRNFLENWRPMPGLDETGRGYTQGGAGEYPLSEPEVYAFVMWLLTHPHISAVNYFDTTGPFHLRGPSSSASEERMYPEDMALYEYFDSLAMSITGYPEAGDVYHDFAYSRGRTHNTLTGDSIIPFPRFGHGPDFGYFYYGSIWYGDEMWNGGYFGDLNDDGELDDMDRLLGDLRYNDGQGFMDWQPYQHPQLGEVEIGGFHPKFFLQNPPPHMLEKWVSEHAMWNLALAMHLPLLELAEPEVRVLDSNRDGTTYAVTVRWTNTGGMPTALRQAQLVRIVQEDQASLIFDREMTRGDEPRIRIIEPSRTSDKSIRAGHTEVGETKEVTFHVRVSGREAVDGTVRLSSTRGGLHEVALRLPPR